MSDLKRKGTNYDLVSLEEVESKIVIVRGHEVLLDRDVAELYGVETKRVNEAVRNNLHKFPAGYLIDLTTEESSVLRSKFSSLEQTDGKGRYSKYNYRAFTEKGLYMLATILKSKRAEDATIAIIETFVKVRTLKRELLELHEETDKEKQNSMMKHFGNLLTDIVMPDLQTNETETQLELNFVIGKLKHTVKRIRKESAQE